MSSSSCRLTVRREAPWPDSGTARPSTGRTRRRPSGTPICLTRTTIAPGGWEFRRTKIPTTPSRSSGRCTCGTSLPTNRSPTIYSRAPRACSSRSSACGPGERGDGSRSRTWSLRGYRRRRPTVLREILLPRDDGNLHPYAPVGEPVRVTPAAPPKSRVAYAAAHVVCDPLADNDPTFDADLDWEATLAYRRHLWSLGLSAAEAMDTAQRGMGLGWETSRELIRHSLAEAREAGGGIACGAGTDHLDPAEEVLLPEIERAYEEQSAFVKGEGGRVILMASRALAACAESPEDYAEVYGSILSQVSSPVIVHWLGEMFDPALSG